MLKRLLLRSAACIAVGLIAAAWPNTGFAQVKPPVPPPVQVAPAAPAAGLPTPAVALQPGTYSYLAKVEPGQATDIPLVTEIKEDPDGWLVSDSITTPAGAALDRAILDKNTLALRKRSVQQGGITIEFLVKDGKLVGAANVRGQETQLNMDIGGDVFSDGAGAHQTVAALPLAEGYTTSFRALDIRSMKLRTIDLKVVGSEQVTVPAGTFDAFKVEIVSTVEGSKTTLWVARDSRKVVKVVQVSPQQGGATVTSELQK
jgi:hypothetical protein